MRQGHGHFAGLAPLAAAAALVMGALWGGCAATGAAPPAALTPRCSFGAAAAQWRAAEALAAVHPNDLVLHGAGGSMVPLYPPSTFMVVHPVPFFLLRRGMTVVYQRRGGESVAHLLVERDSRGWIARGIANPAADEERVTEDNLVGIVRAAFATTEPSGNPVAIADAPAGPLR